MNGYRVFEASSALVSDTTKIMNSQFDSGGAVVRENGLRQTNKKWGAFIKTNKTVNMSHWEKLNQFELTDKGKMAANQSITNYKAATEVATQL